MAKKKRKPKAVFLGRYVMHDAMIHVWLRPDDYDSSVLLEWKPHGYITMEIGGKHSSWSLVVDGALHEIMELSLSLSHGAFQPSFTGLNDLTASSYVFMFDHNIFGQACRHAADMLCILLPVLEKEWKKIQIPEKKR